jgi:hypothetical protein
MEPVDVKKAKGAVEKSAEQTATPEDGLSYCNSASG